MNSLKVKRPLLVATFTIALLGSMNANAGWADDAIDAIMLWAEQAKNYGKANYDRIIKVDAGAEKFTEDFRLAVDEAIAVGQLALNQEMVGANAFLVSGVCESFRADFVGLIDGINQIGNRLAEINGLQANMSMRTQINLLNSFPCKALYPLYRATSESIDIQTSGLITILDETVNGLTTIKELAAYEFKERIFQADNDFNNVDTLDNHLGETLCKYNDPQLCRQINMCRFNINNDVLVGQAAAITSYSASALSVMGWALRSGGEIGLDKLDAMIWGWVGTDVKFNIPKTLGKGLVGVADLLTKASGKVKAELNHCRDIYGADLLLSELASTSAGGVDWSGHIDNLIAGQNDLSNDHSGIFSNQETLINGQNGIIINQQLLVDGQQAIRENQQASKVDILASQENLAVAIAKIQEDQQVILRNLDDIDDDIEDIDTHPSRGREVREQNKSWWKW